MKYGSRDWLEFQYQGVSDDPWGLDWRYSQFLRYHRMIQAVTELVVVDWRVQHVLDIGCATGGFSALLQSNLHIDPALFMGIDIARSAVERAREKFPHIQFKQLDISECCMLFPGKFDFVTCLEVLYYMSTEDRKSAVRDIGRLLRPGGVFLVSSMIGKKPYLTLAALTRLVSSEFTVLHADTMYLKPTILAEKLLMRMGLSKHRPRYGQNEEVDAKCLCRLAAREKQYRRFFGDLAQSHAYVIAQIPVRHT